MKTLLVSVSAVATLAAAVSFLCIGRPSPSHPTTPTPNVEGTKLLGRLPVAFVPNLGQWEHAASYVARIGAMSVFLEQKGWTFTLVERTAKKEIENASARGVAVRMRFSGTSAPVLAAEDQLPGRHNYFLGNDPSRWRSDVPLYGAVRYRDVHPGVDVRAREHDGHFEYDLLLKPGADLEPVEIAVEGVERIHLDGEGALVMETQVGPVRMPAPMSWEEDPLGEKSLVACYYVLRGENRFGFEVAGRRPGWALTVDPGLVWSTFLGGTGWEQAVSALALDAQGATTVAGETGSADFPTTLGAFDTTYNLSPDAFVTRLSPTGSILLYSTFLGGGMSDDYATALALDAQGTATIAGRTSSADSPTTPGAFDTSYNDGGADAFVTRLDMLPTGVAAFGRSSPGCTGPLAISVTSMPRVGNTAFALTCGNAAPNAMGLLALAAAGLATPIPVLGVDLWLDPFSAFFVTFGANSDARGACEFALPIPNQPWFARRRLFAQFVWAGPTSPPPCPPLGLSASNALDITIQP